MSNCKAFLPCSAVNSNSSLLKKALSAFAGTLPPLYACYNHTVIYMRNYTFSSCEKLHKNINFSLTAFLPVSYLKFAYCHQSRTKFSARDTIYLLLPPPPSPLSQLLLFFFVLLLFPLPLLLLS